MAEKHRTTRPILVLAAILALNGTACVGLDDAKKCAEGTGDAALDIDYCTRAIDSGVLSKKDLVATFNNRGNAYADNGEHDQAIANFDRAIDLNPDYALAFYNRGRAYNFKSEYDRAITDYSQAIQLKSNFAEAFTNRGFARARKGEYDRAIADYNQAIRLKPDYALAFYNRGNAYKSKQECDRAIRDYDQATQLDPDNAQAYGKMGMACVLQTVIYDALFNRKKDHDPGSRPRRLLDKLEELSVTP